MKKLFTLAILGIVLHSCQTDPTVALQNKLKDLDKAMGGASVSDKSKAIEFIKLSFQENDCKVSASFVTK